jgi:hypothetical protein
LYSTRALQEQKSPTNKNYMQNIQVVSRSKFPVLSNGALVFAVSLILNMYRKMEETINEKCASIQLEFSAGLKNQVHHSKERKSLVLKHY